VIGGKVAEEQLLERQPITFDERPLRKRFRGAAVMITGAGGSLGNRLIDQLIRFEVGSIACVEHHEASLFRLGERLRDAGTGETEIKYVLADVRQTGRLVNVIDEMGVDALFALAAYKHVPLAETNSDQVADVNVLSTLALADRALPAGVRDFVYPSTDKAVRPPSMYGATKRLVELELLRRVRENPRRRLRIARLVNVLETAGNVIENFTRRLLDGKPVRITDLSMSRYYITTHEATMLLLSAACLDGPRGPLMLPAGEPISTAGIAQKLAAALVGRAAEFEVTGWRPGERKHEELIYGYERLEPTELTGILEVRSDRLPPDARETVRALERAVGVGDDAEVRRLLADAAEAAALSA
jgi:FlaA1/EpsC-like NDP-sugar epimerase